MRGGTRWFAAALVLAVLATLVVAPTSSQGILLPTPCSFPREAHETVRHYSARQVRCAVDTFGPVPGGRATAVCIARRESGLIPTATSFAGMYLGLFQHDARAWPSRYQAYTYPLWSLSTSALSGRTNAIVTIRMVGSAGGWKPAGWRRKDC